LGNFVAKLDKNPVHLGGNKYYTSKIGSITGLIVFIILILYSY